MLLIERHHDVGVPGADGSRVAVGKIDAAVGHADVVDDRAQFLLRNGLADRAVDAVAERRSIFNARSGMGAHMQFELAGIRLREKILSQPGIDDAASKPRRRRKIRR